MISAKHAALLAALLATPLLLPMTDVESAEPSAGLATPESFASIGDTAARAAFVIDKKGIVQYAEQTASPKELPNFDAVKQTLTKLG